MPLAADRFAPRDREGSEAGKSALPEVVLFVAAPIALFADLAFLGRPARGQGRRFGRHSRLAAGVGEPRLLGRGRRDGFDGVLDDLAHALEPPSRAVCAPAAAGEQLGSTGGPEAQFQLAVKHNMIFRTFDI